jgi:cytochrome P450
MTDATVSPRSSARAPGPGGRYGLRNIVRFTSDQLVFLRELADRYGDVVEVTLLGRQWYLVSHPDDIEYLLVKQSRIMGRDDYATVLERALGLGLLTSDGELWKRQRRLMSQAFVPKRIQSYAEAMVRVTEAGIRSWEHGQTRNLHLEMSRITMEVVADVLFGASIGPGEAETVREAMEVINEFFANSPEAMVKLAPWVPTPRNLRMRRAVGQIDELIFRIIAARRKGEPKDDLLGTLLSAQDDDGSRMSDRQLRDEAVTLFLAGHETTALTLAHTLFLLSKHPAVERALHEELTRVLGGRLPTAADVKSLPLTERILKESMRLFPPAWTTGREALEDVEVKGYRIPKGAQILVTQWVVHHDPRWFPNPEGFDPDRWLPERAKDLPRFAYFPFGGGPRVCIGNHFAMMEATLLLAVIVQRWQCELLPGQRLELKPSVTLRQKGPGLMVRLADRTARLTQGSEQRPSAARASAAHPAVGV